MSPFNQNDVDADPNSGYIVTLLKDGNTVGVYVATKYAIAEELADLLLEEDEEGELDGCGISPVVFDTINQFNTVH